METITLSAKGKKLGRLASQVASILMGKQTTSFTRSRLPNISVTISDASKLDINEKRMKSLSYKHYSGSPGGLRIRTAKEVVASKGYGELLLKAIDGMLPKNSLRRAMLKRVTVTE